LFEKKDKLKAKITVLKANVKENEPAIQNLKLQRENINGEIDKLYQQKKDVKADWDDKWYKFEDYMKVVDYIREAKKIQVELKKKEERDKKREEKKKDQNKESGVAEIAIHHTGESEETLACSFLINYFKNQLPKEEVSVSTSDVPKTSNNSKLDEDLKKGLLKVIDREALDNQFSIQVGVGKKKKTKGPKVSKREQKMTGSGLLALDISVASKIKAINLTPPNRKDEIPAFLNTLESRLVELRNELIKKDEEAKLNEKVEVTDTTEEK